MSASRQLAAIIFTDIVGYTALMGEDEQKAFDLLRKNRQLQKPLIEKFNGTWIKEIGDGVLASFHTVTDAVFCAIEIQKACNDVDDLKLRIGIHLGEVVFEDNDVFGDGVNIASRLQALAPIGGIWISESVYKNVSNQKEIRTRFVQEKVLKNVKESVRIYEITTDTTTKPSGPSRLRVHVLPLKKHFISKSVIIFISLVLLLAAMALSYWFFIDSNTKRIESVAVLPFVNESGSTDVEYLSDGMTETLINSLSQLPNLNVKARSSVFRYKGTKTDEKTIGKELNVQAVLNGRVVQHGDALTLYLELVDAATNNRIWGEQYIRKTADLVMLQNEIARDVSDKLRLKLSGANEQKLAKNYTANSEAYQLYLKGRFYLNKATLKDREKATECFEQAIAVDSNYALAYAGLAASYVVSGGETMLSEAKAKAREAAMKAMLLDDNLAEAHAAFGSLLTRYDYDFMTAEREFRRAIELNPNYTNAYLSYGLLLAFQGRWEESFAEFQKALEMEPFNVGFGSTYGYTMILARSYDEAVNQQKKMLELDSNFSQTHLILSYAYWLKGDYPQSVEERAKYFELTGDHQKAALTRQSFAKGGWKGFLQAAISETTPGTIPVFTLATFHAALGEKDQAFAALNQSYENREGLFATLKVDPRLDPLRSDPRFEKLVQRAGFK